MTAEDAIFLGASRKPDDSYQQPEYLALKYGNRHGLVTGATGTGKTVTLQVLAESFSAAGVPVFCADIKGKISAGLYPAGILSALAIDQGGRAGVGIALACFVGAAIMWIIPDRRIGRMVSYHQETPD